MKNSHWGNYWSTGNVSACTGGDSYVSEINLFWLSIFKRINKPFRLLDIGTGNGAIPRLVANTLDNKPYHYYIAGLDSANIDFTSLSLHIEKNNGTFCGYPSKDMSCINDVDGFFDIVTSQFAIEYSDWKNSIIQLSSKIKNKGNFLSIIHSKNGAYFRGAIQELRILKFLDENANIVELFRQELMEQYHLEAPTKDVINSRLNKIKSVGAIFYKKIQQEFSLTYFPQFVNNVFEVISELVINFEQLEKHFVKNKLTELECSLYDHRERLKNLTNGAFSDETLAEFTQCLEKNSFVNIEVGEIIREADGSQIAWSIKAMKV